MVWRHLLFSVSALLAIFAGKHASAADADLANVPEITISAVKTGSRGVYIRGDLGYAGWVDEGQPMLALIDPVSGQTAQTDFDDGRFGRPVSGSLGLGYQFSDMVRADLSADYFEGRFSGSGEVDTHCAGETAGTGCAVRSQARYRAGSIIGSGYVDLATLAGFTPYLGAGLGVTRMRFNDVSLTMACVAGTAACSGAGGVSRSLDGESGWRFTYALMAGMSYDVTERLKLDVGYRYSHIADGDLFRGGDSHGADDGLGRHEVRAGLRLSLW